MLLRPTGEDVRIIVRTTGQAVTVLGIATLVLALAGLFAAQLDVASALAIGGALGLGVGVFTRTLGPTRGRISWTRGVVSAVTAWLACTLLAAVPLYLSGHYASYLDATFDALSGLTTTGLSLIQDLDHLPVLFHLYRTVLHLAGGLAIVVVGLGLLTAATATASSLQPGDVRDERILPNPGRLWRQVGMIASGILAVGTVACTVAVAIAGVSGWRVLLHAVTLAVSAATTGGFAPTSTSVGYYHSTAVELVLVPLMLAGATSFAVHAAAWRGDRLRLARDLEVRTLVASLVVVMAVTLVGLGRSGAYTDVWPLFHQGVFTAVSAHTTTGLHVVTPALLSTDWGLLAPAALVAAMTVGGMTASTAGGLKALRVGIVMKGVVADVRRVLLPESSLVATAFTRGRREVMTDAHVRSAATMLLIFLTATLTGAVALLFLLGSVSLTEALFASTSAATNSGLTLGAFGPGDPALVKLGFMGLMLLGRLEWMAVFAAAGFAFAGLRGRR